MTLLTTTDHQPRDVWRGGLAPGQHLARDSVADLLVVFGTTTRTELQERAA
jgi:hypothetical protein